jgi:hypothetical protein
MVFCQGESAAGRPGSFTKAFPQRHIGSVGCAPNSTDLEVAMRNALLLTSTSALALAFAACSSSSGAPTPDAGPDGAGTSDAATTEAGTPDGGGDASEGGNTGVDSAPPPSDASPSDADSSTEAEGPDSSTEGGDAGSPGPIAATQRVLLISVDGFHRVDLTNWIAAHPASTLASLASTGIEYAAAHTTTPSDSFPGMLALATGGTPRSTGVYYDDSYDRTLYAPGSQCTGSPGTEVIFDESIDYDSSRLFSGGVNAANLPYAQDANGNCSVVFPHDFVKVNTIFELVRGAGGYTAWSDKHPAYEILNGPSGVGINDLYVPEQASSIANAPVGTVNGINLAATLATCDGTTNSLPLAKVSDYTTCEPAALAYDDIRVQAILNEIDGLSSDGSHPEPLPTLFGMNFQALSIAEKLPVGGYTDAIGTPSALLASTLSHIDADLGKLVGELQKKHLLASTLVIISAKHGQSPIDKTKLAMESGGLGNATVQDPQPTIDAVDPNIGSHPSTFVNPNSAIPYDTDGHFQTDDVGLLWIQHSQDTTTTASIVSALQTNAALIFANTLPAGTIFTSSITSGPALAAIYGDPASTDPVAAARAPDVFIQPNWGTIYSGSSKKIAEHGGGTTDDTAVALLVSLPGFASAKIITTSVATTQVATTIVQALGIDPTRLEGAAAEGTAVLPGLF